MTEPRDWDRELAKIDRVIERQQSGAASGPPAPVAGPPPVGTPRVRRRSVALTWFWAGLALALAAALIIWPYQRACGLQLLFYLGAAGGTVLVALLGALSSWSHHRGLAHLVSLLVMVWAVVVAVREVLPRIGYARISRTWTCEPPPPAATSAPAPAQAPSQAPQQAPQQAPATP